MAKNSSNRIFHYLLYIALIGLAIEVMILVQQNRQLRTQSQNLNQALMSLALLPGDRASSFMAIDLNGRLRAIDYPDEAKKTVLLVFSTECAVCEKNMVFWNDFFERADSSRYRITGIAKNDLLELTLFAESKNLKFPILMSDDLSFWWSYKLFRLPQTILVNERGEVEHVWQGVLNNSSQEKILNLIIH